MLKQNSKQVQWRCTRMQGGGHEHVGEEPALLFADGSISAVSSAARRRAPGCIVRPDVENGKLPSSPVSAYR